MSGRIARTLRSAGEFAQNFFTAATGMMAPLRDKGGTYGTQRMNIKARTVERKMRYPTD